MFQDLGVPPCVPSLTHACLAGCHDVFKVCRCSTKWTNWVFSKHLVQVLGVWSTSLTALTKKLNLFHFFPHSCLQLILLSVLYHLFLFWPLMHISPSPPAISVPSQIILSFAAELSLYAKRGLFDPVSGPSILYLPYNVRMLECSFCPMNCLSSWTPFPPCCCNSRCSCLDNLVPGF